MWPNAIGDALQLVVERGPKTELAVRVIPPVVVRVEVKVGLVGQARRFYVVVVVQGFK